LAELRDLLARGDLAVTTKYLLIVASVKEPATGANIRHIAKENGWRAGSKAEPSAYLTKSRHAVKLPKGWQLTADGKDHVEKFGLTQQEAVLTPVVAKLESYVAGLTDDTKAAFVREAIGCLKAEHYRAAIVLSWVGALYLIYKHVIDHRLSDFNVEATKRNPKHKTMSALDDLGRLKESEFLGIAEAIKVITKAQGKELGDCLDRRNTAGHPNSHSFREITVGHHIEVLLDVFKTF
jgi:hypothetical protein